MNQNNELVIERLFSELGPSKLEIIVSREKLVMSGYEGLMPGVIATKYNKFWIKKYNRTGNLYKILRVDRNKKPDKTFEELILINIKLQEEHRRKNNEKLGFK